MRYSIKVDQTVMQFRLELALYDAGDSIEDIANDYNCQPWQIEKAILFECNWQAA